MNVTYTKTIPKDKFEAIIAMFNFVTTLEASYINGASRYFNFICGTTYTSIVTGVLQIDIYNRTGNVTGIYFRQYQLQAKDYGLASFINKPIANQQLKDLIKTIYINLR